jgi:hypothetical protein
MMPTREEAQTFQHEETRANLLTGVVTCESEGCSDLATVAEMTTVFDAVMSPVDAGVVNWIEHGVARVYRCKKHPVVLYDAKSPSELNTKDSVLR